MVPFIDLKRFESGFLEQWASKVAELTSKAEFIGGSEVSAFEKRVSDFIQVPHVVSCANGTDAIQLCLRAIGVGLGDLVVVPDATFWASFEAIVNVGATPLTVDVDATDGGIDFSAFKEAVHKFQPKAAVIAHLYGWGSANLKLIREYCQRNGVLLVEDGAQCFGVELEGESIYKGALISTTSFYPAKVLGAAGDAGAVFTADQELAAKVRRLGNHGRATHYSYSEVGWNSRLDSLQAAYLNLALDYLPRRLASRRQAAAYYKASLRRIGVPQLLPPEGYRETGYCNVCLIEDSVIKEKLEKTLKSAGIGYANIYPGAMSAQPGAKAYLHAHVGGDQASKLCRSVVNLPLFPYINPAELDEVMNVIERVFDGVVNE
jgi:UDP-2-acetamido-2-deoxy-ribo-hexuluronate aminotransferase